MTPVRLLLVEDDPNLGALLQENLQQHGFETDLVADGEDGKRTFLQRRYDLCVIDVMLPRKDGFALASEIRKIDAEVPLIFLTAKSLKEDRIFGLKLGADDYITKPFSFEELALRIERILKRSNRSPENGVQATCFEIGDYTFDYDQQKLKRREHERRLTHKEAELLRLLCLHRNVTLERGVALHQIWGDDSFFTARSMDVFVSKLRRYLKSDARIEIVNVHSRGFKLIAPLPAAKKKG